MPTLKELDVKVGDVVKDWYTDTFIHVERVEAFENAVYGKTFYSNGQVVDNVYHSYTLWDEWVVVSRAEPDKNKEEPMTYKLWKDLSEEEQKDLLYAKFIGKQIESSTSLIKWLNMLEDETFQPCGYYRLKQEVKEPVVETVTKFFYPDHYWNWSMSDNFEVGDKYKLTYEVIDGKINCNTVKLEELE